MVSSRGVGSHVGGQEAGWAGGAKHVKVQTTPELSSLFWPSLAECRVRVAMATARETGPQPRAMLPGIVSIFSLPLASEDPGRLCPMSSVRPSLGSQGLGSLLASLLVTLVS